MDKYIIGKEDTLFTLIDIQERLVAVMEDREAVVRNTSHLIALAKMLNIPIVVTEQYPKGLGPTVSELKEMLGEYYPIEKLTFDCCGEPNFLARLKSLGRKNIIIVGMETHICVLQTCLGLLGEGYNVHLVEDAVCSRSKDNWLTGVEFMRDAGAVITCTETVLFQLLKVAGTEEFKAISKRIK